MRQEKCRGSITVFAALAIMLVAQLLFTLIEGARYIELEKVIQMNTESVLESVFADYCSPLWEEYRLLGLVADNKDGELSFNNRSAQMCMLTKKNLGQTKMGADTFGSGENFLRADVTDIDVDSYLLMTDGNGTVFEECVSAYMKENLTYELAKGIYNNYESIKELQNRYGGGGDQISGALEALKEAHQEREDSGESQPGKNESGKTINRKTVPAKRKVKGRASPSKEDDPLTIVTEAQKKGILNLVLSEDSPLSGTAFTQEECVSKRVLARGNGLIEMEEDWYDKTLFTQYVYNYMSSYTVPMQGHALQYEMEYLIGGKDNDADNLRATVDRLLAVREGLNMASLMSMPDKLAEAETLAIALAGVTANPVVIEAVKYGILAAWAYVESVLDVRALLDGDQIALIKSNAIWTSTIDNFSTILSGWSKAKSCETGGLSYKQYGMALLLFVNDSTLVMRAMDVEEATIRAVEGYSAFRMDHVVCEMSIQAAYEYRSVFMLFVSMVKDATDTNRVIDSARYRYFKGKEGV